MLIIAKVGEINTLKKKMEIKNGEIIFKSWKEVFLNPNISEQRKEETQKKRKKRTRPYNHYLDTNGCPGDNMHTDVRILECLDGFQIQDTIYPPDFRTTVSVSIINARNESIRSYLDDVPSWG